MAVRSSWLVSSQRLFKTKIRVIMHSLLTTDLYNSLIIKNLNNFCPSSKARNESAKAKYLGFDYYPGKNVDVVGDVHKLSSYFAGEEKFDLVYSNACFEYFAMPWIVAAKIVKRLFLGVLTDAFES